MNTYHLTTKSRILSAMASTLVLLFFLGIFRTSIICFGVIGIYIAFFAIKNIVSEHITLSNSGVEYHRVGLTFHAKWENVREINLHWFAPFEQEGIFIDDDLVRITEWWSGSYKAYGGWGTKVFIPLSKFSDNWRDSELGQQIKQYAPHLFERENIARVNP